MTKFQHILALFVGFLTVSGFAPQAYAGPAANESAIKAAIIYNLARFSHWDLEHELNQDSFHICTLADHDMEQALKDLTGKNIHNRKLDIIHLEKKADITQNCQVLYVSNAYMSETDTLEMLDLSEIAQKGILTVGDTSNFIELGGCMSLQRHGKKLRFSINKPAMDSAHIKPSSKILKLAVNPRP